MPPAKKQSAPEIGFKKTPKTKAKQVKVPAKRK